MSDLIEVLRTPTTAIPPAQHTPCMPWCAGDCADWEEPDGTSYHSSSFANVRVKDETGEDLTLDVSVSRLDEQGQIGAPVVHILGSHGGRLVEWESYMPAAGARRLAALLLNAADLGDPLPLSTQVIQASQMRLGDEVLTDAGWQHVTGVMLFAEAGHESAQVFTPERNSGDTDGWPFELVDSVKVRRGSHAGHDTPPPATLAERPTITLIGWCTRCRADQPITGRRVVSGSGVVRVRSGRCGACGKTKQVAVERTAANQIAGMTAKAAQVTQ